MVKPQIGIFDYGSGNLHSAVRALEAVGANILLTSDVSKISSCQAMVLPGVGAFSACMEGIKALGGDDLVREFVVKERALLGICVGHQVLFSQGNENGITTEGIGIYPGKVTKLTSRVLPHMGWNQLSDQRWYYFVHSYAAQNEDDLPKDADILWAHYDQDSFIAAAKWRNITSTQFHPEKSGKSGAALLKRWLASIT